MAEYTIVKFKNLTPLHIGTGRENYDFSASELHSDTLSAAMAAIRVQNGKDNDVKEFLQSFTVSSAFPFIGGSLFLPKPQGKIEVKISDMEEYLSRKKLKKIKYLESSLWSEIVAGQKISVTSKQLKDCFLLSERDVEQYSEPYKSQVNQRVSVHRGDNQPAEPFFFEWKYFNPNAGVYCFLDAPEEIKDELVSLLKQLGETGLGTDRNIGGGKFEVERQEMSLDLPVQSNSRMMLSLYIPTEEELASLNLANSRYELLLRGGYIAGSEKPEFRHLRKKSIYMFNVGSVFNIQSTLRGKVVDLKPEWNDENMHAVFRSGKPFVVPVNI